MESNYYYKSKYIKYKNKYLNSKSGSEPNPNPNLVKAITFFNEEKIKGIVNFEETIDDKVLIKINLEGFEPNSIHGFHVHESGDLTSGCDSMCAHFNPYNKTHGGRDDKIRHVGDLGNLEANNEGKIYIQYTDHEIKLRGDIANIIGRGLIIHADPDDCGKGIYPDSKTTGHSGKRIGCAIIGYASVNH
jgi:Cu-Zn family superoxide dismutase